MICTKTDHIEHAIAYGQSNSTGSKTIPVINAVDSPVHFMFDGGTRPFPNQLNSLVPFKELYQTYTPNGSTAEKGETPLTGIANQLDQSPLLLSVAGVGGLKMDELNKGTLLFDTLKAHMVNGKTLVNAKGKDYRVNLVTWIQGESDIITITETKATYKAKLLQLYKDIVQLAKDETGVTIPPNFVMSQMNWRSTDYEDITLAQYEAARDNYNLILACPTYHLPYSPDKVHLSNIGARLIGSYIGRASQVSDRMMGNWKPLMPTVLSASGSSVNIKFHVPEGALRFNTTEVSQVTDYGFKVMNGTVPVPISSITIAGDTVSLSLSNPPAGVPLEVRYALDYVPTPEYLTKAAVGNLSDTSTTSVNILNNEHLLHNFGVAFSETITLN